MWILRRACYDEGKWCAIFNTEGPRMHENDGRVVSNFVVQALAGKPLTEATIAYFRGRVG